MSYVLYSLRLIKNIKKAVESLTVFCGTLLTRRDRGEGAPRRESPRTRGIGVGGGGGGGGGGSTEREARRKKGGRGVAEV